MDGIKCRADKPYHMMRNQAHLHITEIHVHPYILAYPTRWRNLLSLAEESTTIRVNLIFYEYAMNEWDELLSLISKCRVQTVRLKGFYITHHYVIIVSSLVFEVLGKWSKS